MSIYKNGKLIAGGRQCMPLLSFMWADHQLNDISWLRADTFSWQSGSVYQAVYQHLADDIDGKTLQSETIGSTTIQFYLADDGHKICPASEESNVVAIYNATGVAWYYIIDTVNQRFKLPRTKFAFTGIRSSVGDYVGPALPNIKGGLTNVSSSRLGGISGSGALSATYKGQTSASGNDVKENVYNIGFSANSSSNIYKDGATVQPSATEMYLYFYVGQFTQTALENTAGVVTEDFNELNAHKVIDFQAPTADNGYTWYRKYADGWVEQGGKFDIGSEQTANGEWTITLPVEMADNNYTGIAVPGGRTTGGSYGSYAVVVDSNNTTTQLQVYIFKTETAYRYINWTVSGMAAS